jgi:predicted secreted acid phosphatase
MKSGKSYKYNDLTWEAWEEFTSADEFSGAGEYYNYYIKK